jgi:uncharacterized glyoxalase superfamily protein PhnB
MLRFCYARSLYWSSEGEEMSVDTIESASSTRPYQIVGLSYVSLYLKDFDEAISFYSSVFGPTEYKEGDHEIYGWRMGSTWLTVFQAKAGTSKDSNPRNTEFAVQVSAPEEVDALYNALIEAGAKECMPPRDTKMYEDMRYGCVDDHFGVRIDVYCPLPGQ